MAEGLTIPATRFKANCSALIDQLDSGRLDKIVVIVKGVPIAELTPPRPPEIAP